MDVMQVVDCGVSGFFFFFFPKRFNYSSYVPKMLVPSLSLSLFLNQRMNPTVILVNGMDMYKNATKLKILTPNSEQSQYKLSKGSDKWSQFTPGGSGT